MATISTPRSGDGVRNILSDRLGLAVSPEVGELTLAPFVSRPLLYRWIGPRILAEVTKLTDRLMDQYLPLRRPAADSHKHREHSDSGRRVVLSWPRQYMESVRAWGGGAEAFSTVPSALMQTVNSQFMGNCSRACPSVGGNGNGNESGAGGFLAVALRASATALARSGARYQQLVDDLIRAYQARELLSPPSSGRGVSGDDGSGAA